MDRTPVESSNIASVGWEDGVLEVEFTSGLVYSYEGVPDPVDLAKAREDLAKRLREL